MWRLTIKTERESHDMQEPNLIQSMEKIAASIPSGAKKKSPFASVRCNGRQRVQARSTDEYRSAGAIDRVSAIDSTIRMWVVQGIVLVL